MKPYFMIPRYRGEYKKINWWSLDKKEPPLALLPVMFVLGLAGIVAVGWAVTRLVE